MAYQMSTALTDYALSVACLVWAIMLWRSLPAFMSRARRLWATAFAFNGLAALAGGVWHGVWSSDVLWFMAYLSIPLASMLLVLALVVAQYWQPRKRRVLMLLLVARFMLVAAAVVIFRSDVLVYVDAGLTLIAVTLVGCLRGFRWLIVGSALTLVAGAFQLWRNFGLGILDHNGIYHLVQIAGMYCWYRVGRHLHDAAKPIQARV